MKSIAAERETTVVGSTSTREMDAFMRAIGSQPADALTGCREWTAHEVGAHLAGNSAEIARAVDAYADGRPVPSTRGFEERQAPFRALPHAALIQAIVDETEHMNSSLGTVLSGDPEAVIPWTGRQMRVADFRTHMRNEFALHRWDLVGDDDTSMELLSQPDLTAHSVKVLGHILPRAGMEAKGAPEGFRARLRSPGASDVLLSVEHHAARMWLADPGDGLTLSCDSAARLLFMWGRRPADGSRFRSEMAEEQFWCLARLCAGY
jgi:uncharacterized protein (TIGR03083 family)